MSPSVCLLLCMDTGVDIHLVHVTLQSPAQETVFSSTHNSAGAPCTMLDMVL